MFSIFADPDLPAAFRRENLNTATSDPSTLKLDVLDWFENRSEPCSQTVSAPDLPSLPVPLLRIIFSPLDLPDSPSAGGISWLFDYYSLPTAFLGERIRSVTHSFGALDDTDGNKCSWFHYLCKNITVHREADEQPSVYDPRTGGRQQEYADWTWIRSGYILRWAENTDRRPQVTFICFGASLSLEQRFRRLPSSPLCRSVTDDPYSLFAIVLDDLSLQMDNTVWGISDVFGSIELNILGLNKKRESFTGLHNVSKHIIFLKESSDAVLLTLKNLSMHHQLVLNDMHDNWRRRRMNDMTQRMLRYVENEFETVNLRLQSLEKRMQNVIALSFHLVTQDGNIIMQNDSNSMATIAFVTLIFLPISTISTIFGSQFFSFDPSMIRMSKCFWIFWLISFPITFIVLLFWHISIKGGILSKLQKGKELVHFPGMWKLQGRM